MTLNLKSARGPLFVAAFLRLLVFSAFYEAPERALLSFDSGLYDTLSRNLVSHGQYSLSEAPPFLPHTAWPPGYAGFVALLYWLLGPQLKWVILAQIALSILTVGLVWRLGTEVLDRRSAAIAAWISAVDLGTITYAHFLLSETLFTFLMTGSICALALGARGKPLAWQSCSAAALACAAYVRPIALYFPLCLVVVFFVSGGKDRRLAWGRCLGYLAFFALILSPWVLRNRARAGITAFSTVQHTNLFDFRAAGVLSQVQGISMEEARDSLYQSLARCGAKTFREEIDCKSTISLEVLRTHPLQVFVVTVRGIFRIFLPDFSYLSRVVWGKARWEPSASVTARRSGVKSGIEVLVHRGGAGLLQMALLAFDSFLLLAVLLLSMRGILVILLSRPSPWRPLLLCGAPLAYFLLISAGPESHARFRVPLMPYLSLLAALGASRKAFSARRRDPAPP